MKRFMGTTDEVTNCELCGKTNLKATYVFEIDGAIIHVGSECAKKNFGIDKAPSLARQLQNKIWDEETRFKNRHPLSHKTSEEIREANNQNISYKERQAQGLFSRWAEYRSQICQDWEAYKKTITIEC